MLELLELFSALGVECKFVNVGSDELYVLVINESSEYFTSHTYEELLQEIDMKITIANTIPGIDKESLVNFRKQVESFYSVA